LSLSLSDGGYQAATFKSEFTSVHFTPHSHVNLDDSAVSIDYLTSRSFFKF